MKKTKAIDYGMSKGMARMFLFVHMAGSINLDTYYLFADELTEQLTAECNGWGFNTAEVVI